MSADIPVVGDGSGLDPDGRIHAEELHLALRNHVLPLEGLRYDVTPTGMHYTLIHYDVPAVDERAWSLGFGGSMRAPRAFTLDELRARPVRTQRVTLECAGDGRALLSPRPISQPWLPGAVGTAEWTGTPLAPLLASCGLGDDVVDVVFTGLDHGIEGGVEQDYQRALPLAEAMHPDALLAWSMNGAPLEPQHGAPLRLIIPGWYGMAHVKWLRAIDALTAPFAGYQHHAYRYGPTRDGTGEPVTLMRVRSMMIPPGFPDFLTRTRIVARGAHVIEGRAWSGRSSITRVELSADGGATWSDAALAPEPAPHAWRGWRAAWEASVPGACELVCRATDATGAVQPIDPAWTARGMGNNMAHRVRIQIV